MGVNEMHVKNITVTVSVRVSVAVTVRVSLVRFVSSKSFASSSVAICRPAVCKLIAFCLYTRPAVCIGKMQSTCTRPAVCIAYLYIFDYTYGRPDGRPYTAGRVHSIILKLN